MATTDNVLQETTAIHKVVCNGDIQALQKHLNNSTNDVNKKSSLGKTALHYAASYGRKDMVLLLIEKKADDKILDIASRSAFHEAVEEGHIAVAEKLASTIEQPLPDEHGRTVLHLATKSGSLKIVDTLLQKVGNNIDSQDKRGQTALHLAAQNGFERLFEKLLESGADLNLLDNQGNTALDLAEGNEDEAVKKLLRNALFRWVAENRNDNAPANQLLKSGKFDVDSKDGFNRTLLSWAAEKGNGSILQQLLGTGKVDADSKDESGKVDADSKDESGRTPLSWAAAAGHDGVVELLLGTGKVNVDSKDDFGQTPLLWAIKGGYNTIVEQLLGTGKINIDSKDRYGQTPLSLAIEVGNDAIIEQLRSATRTN